MPIVTIQLLEGYDEDAKARLGSAMTDAVRMVIAAPPEAITTIVQDIPNANYMRGGTHRTAGPVNPDPSDVVRVFLAAMEARDLAAAQAMLGDGFEMTFPGDIRMTDLQQLINWAAPRYRFVRKSYERFDSLASGDRAIVYCFGTLAGEWNDGTVFADIRFIDRFEVMGGRITRQQVWNDMAEVKRT